MYNEGCKMYINIFTALFYYKEQYMNEDDKLKEQQEAEAKAKAEAEEQAKKEAEEQAKKEAEEQAKKEADDPIYNEIKSSYEEKLKKQEAELTAKIDKRDKIIKQLMAGESNANNDTAPSFIDKLNAQREAQKRF